MPATNQLLAQGLEIVSFPVLNDPEIVVGIGHRHVAGCRKVYDAQTVRAETDLPEGNHPIIVRTAVRLKLAHPADDTHVIFFTALPLQTDQSGNSTHIVTSR